MLKAFNIYIAQEDAFWKCEVYFSDPDFCFEFGFKVRFCFMCNKQLCGMKLQNNESKD